MPRLLPGGCACRIARPPSALVGAFERALHVGAEQARPRNPGQIATHLHGLRAMRGESGIACQCRAEHALAALPQMTREVLPDLSQLCVVLTESFCGRQCRL